MNPDRRNNRGVALIVVLFLSAILTLLMYSFLREMQVEYSLASSLGSEKQAEQLAWSAIDKGILTVQADTASFAGPQSAWYNSASDWYEAELSDAGVYSMIRANASGETAPIFGIMDEASKVNINIAPRDVLMKLPRMTDEIADSIIDWRDADDVVTASGGESAYYQSLQPGYACKNGPFDSVEELLLVKGVTPEVLYGEDANQNGVLDPNEDDGDKDAPHDNTDGVLDAGLMAFVTVWSYDRNARADGKKRVNINTAAAGQLREALSDVLEAKQIEEIPVRRVAVAAAVRAPGFRSGADLMDVAGVSPPGITPEQYRKIADRVTIWEADRIPGLINVNTACRKVLEALPGWTAADASVAIEYRTQADADLSNVCWLTNVLAIEKVQSAAPLLTVRSYQFRMDAVGRAGPRSRLDTSALTARSTSKDEAMPPARVIKRFAAVYDKAGTPPRLVYWKDVSRLGMPYPIEEQAQTAR